jgi:CHAT domain-containing protein
MRSLYKHLGQGDSLDEALQAAQQDVARQKRWKSPYYWAAFVPIGDGGTV